MNSIYIDAHLSDDARRQALYEGKIFVNAPALETENFCQFASNLIREAFDPLDPERAQWDLPVEKFVDILKELKPRFIHHPQSKVYIQHILENSGCDMEKTYFDVPRLRTSTSNNYLTSGIAYAFHPHRDTWYSAPMCQINWWMPVYEMHEGNGMALHTDYWDQEVPNSSGKFSYSEWQKNGRKNSASNVKTDTREQPGPTVAIELDSQLRLVTRPGGVILFSAAHLHSSVPNETGKTRFSIDFRTVNIDDLQNGIGARNLDTHCQDLTLGDFL
ncbi:MAG TPA: hypothetical protein VG737_03110, partial [Cyclobacteriaceae bacterium]|nr:hypothetical protein [Cyclobacteriaceae bacterium]